MIQSTSALNTTFKPSDKSITGNSKTAQAFMQLFNEFKQEVDSLGKPVTEKEELVTNDDEKGENELVSYISALLENQSEISRELQIATDPQIIEEELISYIKTFIGKIDNQNGSSLTGDEVQKVAEKITQLFLEGVPSLSKEDIQLVAKAIEENINNTIKKGAFSSNEMFETTEPSKIVQVIEETKGFRTSNEQGFFTRLYDQSKHFRSSNEQSFDFHKQFGGQEVIFQSLNRSVSNNFVAVEPGQNQQPRVSPSEFITEVMKLIENQASVKQGAGLIEAKFSLTPEKLGDIDVRLTIEKGQVIAQFLTETGLGKDALESQIALLKSSFEQQGLQVNKIEISQNAQSMQSFFSNQEERSRQEQSQQRFSKKQNHYDQSDASIEGVVNRGENTINILA